MLIVRLLFFLLLVPGLVFATIPSTETTDRTYCEDEETRRDWEERTANNPDDTALHTLHALWIGLCAKVTRNEFTTDQADEVFEYVRRSFIERRREYNAEKEDKPKLSAALGTTPLRLMISMMHAKPEDGIMVFGEHCALS